MNYKMVSRIVGSVLCLETLFMAPGMLLCLYDGEGDVALAYALGMAVTLGVGGVLCILGRHAPNTFYAQEGFTATGLTWIAMSALGCLPFVFSGQIPRYVDAFFEMVSGFTTTGASILTDVEGLSRGLLFWRSFSHWLGGMGVLVFLLAVVPKTSGGSSLHLLRAESPGPSVDKLTSRLGQTTRILYGLYLALTLLDIFFLLAGGMPLFEALCHAFGTAGTGGFGVKNSSYIQYSPYLQNVTTVFMALFGVNFSIYYLLMLGQVKKALRDEELRTYLCIFFVSIALIALNIRGMYHSWEETLRHAAFQVSSILTTTGYCTVDFDQWPSFSKGILLCLMLLGACAGSTGGGMKASRFLLLLKSLRRSIRKTLRPRSVQLVQMNGRTVHEEVLGGMYAYFAAYFLLIAASFLILCLDGFPLVTNLSAAISCFNNIGPGLELVGPVCNYSAYSDLSKIVLSLDMLFGRLEIFPMLVLLSRRAWSRTL